MVVPIDDAPWVDDGSIGEIFDIPTNEDIDYYSYFREMIQFYPVEEYETENAKFYSIGYMKNLHTVFMEDGIIREPQAGDMLARIHVETGYLSAYQFDNGNGPETTIVKISSIPRGMNAMSRGLWNDMTKHIRIGTDVGLEFGNYGIQTCANLKVMANVESYTYTFKQGEDDTGI